MPDPPQESARKTPASGRLYLQVLAAIAIGIFLGYFFPAAGEAMKPLGDGFIKLIKMLIVPVIFCTVVTGIAGMKEMKHVGKTGGLALLYFEIVTTIALLVGLIVVNVLRPGAGMNVDPSTLDTAAIASYVATGQNATLVEQILNIIPTTLAAGFVNGDILQALLVSILFGFALQRFGGKGCLIFDFVEKGSRVLFAIVGIIMKLAPIGAFGAMAFTIGKYGVGTLLPLAKLMGAFYLTCLFFIFGVLGVIARSHGFSILRLINYIREELLIVLGTSSSESVLPRMITRLENLGVKKSTVGLIVPTGYSFNLDGTSIYLTMAAVFIAQATNTPLDFGHQFTLIAVLLLMSKGAAGVTGSGFIVLAAAASTIGHIPVAGLTLILGIDRFMSEGRALTNLVGNAVATLVVGRWCDDVDREKLAIELKRGPLNRPPEASGINEKASGAR